MLVVAYHLIRPSGHGWLSGVPAMSPDELAAQLDELASRYRFISPAELRHVLRTRRYPDDGCVLTFDDGYIGQHQHALPLLVARGIRAFFFMPTAILEDARCPVVEKQRVLQYALWDYPEFYRRFVGALRVAYAHVDPRSYEPTDENLAAAGSYYAEYAFYSPLERLFRKVREQVLTGPEFDAVIDRMFAAEFDERDFVRRYFMGWEHVAELRAMGMEIGGHGHEHLIDTAVAEDVAAADARRCLAILRSRLHSPVWSYCYPYGIVRPQTLDVLAAEGIAAGFTCRPGHGDGGSSLLLDRVDCRSLP